jgi:hypothetical protein
MFVPNYSNSAEECGLVNGPKFTKLESSPSKMETIIDQGDIGDSLPEKKPLKQRILFVVRITMMVVLVSGICVFVGFLIGSNSVQNFMLDVLHWLTDLPKWLSAILMVLFYGIGLLFFCPGTPFNLAAGYIYGMWVGFAVAFGGCILGTSTIEQNSYDH